MFTLSPQSAHFPADARSAQILGIQGGEPKSEEYGKGAGAQHGSQPHDQRIRTPLDGECIGNSRWQCPGGAPRCARPGIARHRDNHGRRSAGHGRRTDSPWLVASSPSLTTNRQPTRAGWRPSFPFPHPPQPRIHRDQAQPRIATNPFLDPNPKPFARRPDARQSETRPASETVRIAEI